MIAAPTPDSACVRLPQILDLRSAASLAGELTALRGRPVSLDASGVERLGGLGLQVLLSALVTWRGDGWAFAVTDASEAFRADCAALGVRAFEEFKGVPND